MGDLIRRLLAWVRGLFRRPLPPGLTQSDVDQSWEDFRRNHEAAFRRAYARHRGKSLPDGEREEDDAWTG